MFCYAKNTLKAFVIIAIVINIIIIIVVIISKLPKIFTTFLFATSITSWQMNLTCTNGAKQHLYVHIVTRIKLLVTWLLDVKHR